MTTDLLSGCGFLSPVVGTPGITGLTGQGRPQDPGTVYEYNARGEQACCLQPPRGHRDEGEEERQHQGEGDEEDVEAAAEMGCPKLVDGPNYDQGTAVAEECADDQHPPHVFLQPMYAG